MLSQTTTYNPATYYAQAQFFTLIYWIVFFIVYFAVGFACAFYVYNDAKNTRMNKTGWAIIAFILPVLGLLIYLLIKTSKEG